MLSMLLPLLVPGLCQADGLTIQGSTFTLSANDELIVDGDVTLNSGVFTATRSTITVSGSWLTPGGSYTLGTSTMVFNGAANNNLIEPRNGNFYRIVILGSGDWSTSTRPITVSSTVVVSGGSLSVAPGSTMTVVGNMDIPLGGTLVINADMAVRGGAFTNAGTVTTADPSATFTLNGGGSLGGSGVTQLPGLVLAGAAQTTTLAGPVHIAGTLNNQSGHTLDVNGSNAYTLTVSSSWINSGTFTARTGMVALDGASAGLTIDAGSSSFYGLTINGTGGWQTTGLALNVSSSVVIQSGSLTVAAGSSMTVTGNIDLQATAGLTLEDHLLISGGSLTNAGTINSLAGSTLTLTGSGTLGGPGSTLLPSVLLQGAGLTTLGGDASIQGPLLIDTGRTLDANSSGNYQLTISSNWTNLGDFISRAGTVEFNSTATLTGQTTFYNFSALTPGIAITFPVGSTQTVTGALTIAGSSLNLIRLRSSSDANPWYFRSTGSDSIYAVDVRDSVASAHTLDASASLNSGNNVNWTFGTTRTWVGPGNWSVAGNWNPAGVPEANDSVIFSNANNCTVDISTTVATMTLQSSYSGTVTVGQPLTVKGAYTQAGGTFNLASQTLYAGSNWIVTGGTFVPGTGTVLFNATANGRQITTSGRPFYNVEFNGTGAYWTMQDSMTVLNTLRLNDGTLDSNASGNYGLLVTGEWLSAGGNFVANLSTVTFNGSAAGLRIQPGGDFGYLYWTGAGSWITDGGPLSLAQNATIAGGQVTVVSGSSMTVGGNFYIQATGTLSMQEDLAVNGGTLQNSGSMVSAATATLSLAGTGTLGGSGSTRLPHLTLSGVSQTTTLSGALVLQGALSNAVSHTLDANNSGNYGITISSSWLNAGSYAARTSSVTFAGSASGQLLDPGPSPFYKILFSGSGDWTTANSAVTVSSVVFLSGGQLTIAAGSSMTVTNNLFVSAGATLRIQDDVAVRGGTFSNAGNILALDSSKTVTIAGAGNLGGSGATTLPRLALTGAGQTTTLAGPMTLLGDFANGVSHTLDANASSNFAMTVSSSWVNSGVYVARQSSVTLNGTGAGLTIDSGHSNFYKLALNGAGSYGVTNRPLTISSTVVLNAGTFIVSGSSLTAYGDVVVGAAATLDIEQDMGLSGGSLLNSGLVTSANPAALLMSSGTVSLGGSGATLVPRLLLTGSGKTTTLAGPLSVLGDLTNSSGHTLDVGAAGQYALTVSSSWVNFGSFQAQSGSVTLSGSATGLAINPGSSPFYKLAVSGSGSWYTATNPVTVSSDVRVNAGTLGVAAGSSMTVVGNLDIQPGGAVDLQNHMLIKGGSLTNAGTLTSLNTSTLTLTGAGTLGGAGATSLGGLVLNGSGQTSTLAGNLSVLGPLTISSGHTFSAGTSGSYQITVSSNWTNSGIFTPQSGAVVFNSTATLAGNTTFYNLTAATPGITLTLSVGTTQAITGTLTLTGQSGDLVTIRTTSAGTRAYLRSLGSAAITYVDVRDNQATGSVLSASASNDSGNNVNWIFATTRIWKGASSTGWNTAANWSPSGVPTSVDTVIFDNTSSRNCSINTTAVAGTFTMQGSNTRTISFSNGTMKLSVSGDLSIGGGTFNQGTSAVMVGGSWNKSGGTYTAGTSSVTFNGSGSGNLIASGGIVFYRIGINGPGQWTTTGGPLTVSSDVVMNNGTLVIASGSTMTVVGNMDVGQNAALSIQGDLGISGGSLYSTGTVTSNAGVVLSLSGAGTLGGTGSTQLPAVNLSGAAQTTTLAGPISLLGSLTIAANHTLDVSSGGNYQISLSSSWANSGTFTGRSGTVLFMSSASLSGSSTFYNLTATTAGSAFVFTAGSTQTITNLLTMTGTSVNRIQLQSTTASPFYLKVTGTATVGYVAVQRSVASGKTIYAGQGSLDNGQNSNWVFNYPPGDITNLSASAQFNGDVLLSWSAPSDPDGTSYGSGSQFAIEWSTYAVSWSTSNTSDTGYTFTHHVYISTQGVNAGDPQVYVSTGLTGKTTYYFRVWTQDAYGTWSTGISNGSTSTVTLVLSLQLQTTTYGFGSVPMGGIAVASSAFVVGNLGNAAATYEISVSTINAAKWAVGVSTPTSYDRFVLFGQFNSVKPSSSTYSTLDVIVTTPTPSSSAVYSGDQTGNNVPPSADRSFWLRLDMPPLTSTVRPQEFQISFTSTSP